jgi:outer membrane lipoprotein SlyB
MAQINVPQRRSNEMGTIGTIAGGIVGGIMGRSGGSAIAGAQAGNFIGGAMDQASNKNQMPSIQAPSAMQRRQDVLETDNLTALRNAEVASAQLPEKQRQDVMGVLAQARLRQEQMDKARQANQGYEGYA